jgi:hypothetical protein
MATAKKTAARKKFAAWLKQRNQGTGGLTAKGVIKSKKRTKKATKGMIKK